jgi:hypothetical protein
MLSFSWVNMQAWSSQVTELYVLRLLRKSHRVWQDTPVILALGTLRQENSDFEASLGYIGDLGLSLSTHTHTHTHTNTHKGLFPLGITHE